MTAAQPGPAGVSAGERAYARCLACHALTPQGDDRDGPTLHGVFGREVAGLDGYPYSPALRAYAQRQPRWTRAALDAFLADPQAVAPDNAMGFFGLRDSTERAALIDWLASDPAE
jgi:cytochrome c